MAATALGIWNHQAAASQSLAGKNSTPMAATANDTSGTSGTSTSSSDSATISANDFLTLLVTEMKNQDPTAATDPNEYINQLVNVNSLQQLISINQTLSTSLGTSSATAGSSSTTRPTSDAATATTSSATAQSASAATGANYAPGNLSVPEAKPAAHSIAEALSGRHVQ